MPDQQLSIFDTADTLTDRFQRFHTANPWVYDTLVGLARDDVEEQRLQTLGDRAAATVSYQEAAAVLEKVPSKWKAWKAKSITKHPMKSLLQISEL